MYSVVYLNFSVCTAFASHKEDRRRILDALGHAHLPHTSKGEISLEEFTFDKFLIFYMHLCGRSELQEIFLNM